MIHVCSLINMIGDTGMKELLHNPSLDIMDKKKLKLRILSNISVDVAFPLPFTPLNLSTDKSISLRQVFLTPSCCGLLLSFRDS